MARVVDEEIAEEFYQEGFPLSAKVRYSVKLLRYRDSLYTQGEALMNRLVRRDAVIEEQPPAAPEPATERGENAEEQSDRAVDGEPAKSDPALNSERVTAFNQIGRAHV